MKNKRFFVVSLILVFLVSTVMVFSAGQGEAAKEKKVTLSFFRHNQM